MADSKLVQSGMQRLVECSVCLEIYQSPSKVPKNLKCGHTFCSECLLKLMIANKIRCSNCRQKTLVPDGEVDKLATNFTALDFLETSCEECRNHQWVSSCDHCSKNVCEACHNIHLKLDNIDIQDKLEEAKERIVQISEICNDDTYLRDLDNNAEAAEEEVIEYWDGVARKVEERKKEDVMKIRHRHKEACEEFMMWKVNAQMSIVKAKGAVEKFLSRHDRKYLGPIPMEELEDITQTVEKLLSDLECDVSQKPATAGYEIDLRATASQLLLEQGVVKIVSEESPANQKITLPPTISDQLPQYTQATYIMTYGQKGSDAGQFENPWGVATSPNTGNIVITDQVNHRIHTLSSSLQPVSVSGAKISESGWYYEPSGVAVSPNTDQIYVVDRGNNRIQVLKGNGSYQREFGYHGFGPDGLYQPRGIAVDRSGLLYVCDGNMNRIKVIHPDGRLHRSFGTVGKKPWEFSSDPRFIAVSQVDKLVVSDDDGHLYIFTSQGQHIRTIQKERTDRFNCARGVAIDQFGNIIVADKADGLFVLKEDGQVVCKIGSYGKGPGQFYYPMGVALTSEGDIVVADRYNRVQLWKVPKA